MKSPIRTLIADDHKIVVEGIMTILRAAPMEIEIVDYAEDWRSCISKLHEYSPDLLITDLEMPGGLSTDELGRIKQQFPKLKVIVLTMHYKSSLIRMLLGIGVEGYVVKTFGSAELLEAIQSVTHGEEYIATSERDKFHRINAELTFFSKKQKNVLALLTLGLQAKEISAHSGVSVSYVQTIIRDAKKKYGLKDKFI